MTAAELLALPEDHQRHELVRGEPLTEADELAGGAVLPGFSCPVAELFA